MTSGDCTPDKMSELRGEVCVEATCRPTDAGCLARRSLPCLPSRSFVTLVVYAFVVLPLCFSVSSLFML